jgi:pimeloyl-ACP methyl ester carboxylesterase
VTLALHELRRGDGPALLLLHALFGSAADWRAGAAAWRGPVYALDFCGHGASDWVAGGAYSPELLAGDADVALARIGTACVAGAGIGAWAALLLAGARPDHVPAALLLPGHGLAGAGPVPEPERGASDEWLRVSDARLVQPARGTAGVSTDPLVMQLDRDLRPLDYAEAFASRARRVLLVEDGSERPAWWQAIAKSAAPETFSPRDLPEAFARLAEARG